MRNPAIILTCSRLLIPPLFWAFYTFSHSQHIFILFLLIAYGEASDFFDGFIARRYGFETDFGKVFDPISDSLYRVAIFCIFTAPPISLPFPLILLFMYRDLISNTFRITLALKGRVMPSLFSGKLKATLQGVTVLTILGLFKLFDQGHISQTFLHNASMLLTGATGVYALYSGIDYIRTGTEMLKK